MSTRESLSAHYLPDEENYLRDACGPDPAFSGNDMRQDAQSDDDENRDPISKSKVDVLPTARILDISAFLTSIGDLPIFTRKLFSDAAAQLLLAQVGKEVELADCYGGKHIVGTEELLFSGKVSELIYNGYHVLADDNPYNTLELLDLHQALVSDFGENVEEMVQYSRFAVYIRFRQTEMPQDYDLDLMLRQLAFGTMLWNKSLERTVVTQTLRKIMALHTLEIDNIVCLGHGSLGCGVSSIMQHIVASSVALELTSLYEEQSRSIHAPIIIVSQDPAYTVNDRGILLGLPVPIRIVADPEGFLAINENSLVMSCFPVIPVKQIVADLAADSISGKGPAAVLWNNSWWDEQLGNIDLVNYPWKNVAYFANASSRRSVDMLRGYTKVMDGAEVFGNSSISEYSEISEVKSLEESRDSIDGKDEIDLIGRGSDEFTFEDISIEEATLETRHMVGVVKCAVAVVTEVEPENELEDIPTAIEDISKSGEGLFWFEEMEIWVRIDQDSVVDIAAADVAHVAHPTLCDVDMF